ncbi:3-keto-disaccharide hydrolase [Tuwongella immobilis]|uniref:3-keto-alpha-glucoside-1,2-lyase/3-keto-2-hydroxy-glucal hydratase domain-containing protein n=1 Tax=Tuwongella immobilis TaxID=692036 RepID=A0A6C2YRR3_9BACT|nr:DUF1080 domain-containing protein [Tuwongella immobilis]VIP03572.1 Uncharacterized protein OS=Isosphaera pallida (strain ATCC 43644 / DSM 9630 / IS1B) GN=Isop_1476 PE=4 SV=1: DUF1080 [Tuwongella immobilis]VTS04512.1 Uncharacterized protein OS=Isosphaera pallida (strain ATCC 43644 / DSM 9630 / IS1B) GN=Isop_1476 PE=4 SV=1: DUF1080 [Tuwongella immobilis]
MVFRMIRRSLIAGGMACLLLVSPASAQDVKPEAAAASSATLTLEAVPETEWVSLFNGKDMTGWKISKKSDPAMKWEVKDGLLVGSGKAGMLYSEKSFENFHFKVEAKINDKGNSGQYFRCSENPGFLDGYEAQINATHRDPIKTGSLYKFDKTYILNNAPHKPDEFFTQEVIANGNHIQIFVNGKKVTDIVDEKGQFKKGHFAIQQHDPGSIITIRKIEVKELPASK